MTMTKVGVAAMALTVALTAGACGDSKKKSSSTPSGAGGTTVTAQDFRFEPAALTFKAGESVTVTFKNGGGAEHNFSIKEASVNQDASPGSTKTVTFTAPAAGTYQFFCEYHKDSKNMVGTLQVTA